MSRMMRLHEVVPANPLPRIIAQDYAPSHDHTHGVINPETGECDGCGNSGDRLRQTCPQWQRQMRLR